MVEKIAAFVLREAKKPDLQLAYLPLGLSRPEAAAYLLMVASVNQGARAEVVGEFIRGLWDALGRAMFQMAADDPVAARRLVLRVRDAVRLSRATPFDDATVLRSASVYLSKYGDLVAHATRFEMPAQMVDHLGKGIFYFGRDPAGARKKAWMYMRWMVRPEPDLGLFQNFSPRDLEMPLDRNTCRALAGIGTLLPNESTLSEMSSDNGLPTADAANRRLATEFAKKLFPGDPAIMDYPFFLLGRERDIQGTLLGT
jgi:hypothetical protein